MCKEFMLNTKGKRNDSYNNFWLDYDRLHVALFDLIFSDRFSRSLN